jgi:ELWxxDGT repeat protein
MTRTGWPALRLGALLGIVSLAAAARAADDPTAGPAHLVRNINTAVDLEESSDAKAFAVAGDLVFFAADDGVHGRELWRTDGTPAGTVLVRDIVPGAGDGLRYWARIIPFEDLVGFWAEDGMFWRSDGTAKGTFPLVERAFSAVGAGDKLFFAVYDTLWMSDGSREGTVPVRKFVDLDDDYEGLTLLAGPNRLYVWVWIDDFYAHSHPEAHPRIWAADYTDLLTATSPPQAAFPVELPVAVGLPHEEIDSIRAFAGDTLIFLASTKYFAAQDDAELWRSDGTVAGTFPLMEASPGLFRLEYYRAAPHLTTADEHVFFIADDGEHGFEPWISDGTREGTYLYADLIRGPAALFPCRDDEDWGCEQREGSASVNLVPSESGLLIARAHWDAADNATTDLWESDGSPSGTRKIEDAVPGAGLSDPRSMAGRAGALIFSVWNSDHSEIWFGDGTLSGSHRVASFGAREFIEAANGFVFPASNPAGPQNEPWWSDGTPEGTYLLRDIRPGDAASAPRHLTDLNGALLFSADEPNHGRELWRSDGSEEGTEMIADIRPGPLGSGVSEIKRIADLVMFAADDGEHGTELWSSDGTQAGTTLVRDINPGAGSSTPTWLTVGNGLLYFFADDGEHGIELWSSNGTKTGTLLVADVNTHGNGGGDPYDPWDDYYSAPFIAPVGGSVFFAADDGIHGVELWRSDGPGKAATLFDIVPGQESSFPHALLAFGDTVFFNTRWDNQLWRSNVRSSVTSPLNAPAVALDHHAFEIGGQVVFFATVASQEFQLWTFDEARSRSVELFPRIFTASEQPPRPVTAAGSIFVLEKYGFGPWRSDVDPGDYYYGGYVASGMTNVGERLIFATRTNRWEDSLDGLWTTDGTQYGTRQLQQLPSPNHSYSSGENLPEPRFVVAGDHVFFAADIGNTGRELWELPLDALPKVQPIPSPTATQEEVATATPTPTTEATATPPAACALVGGPPGCARLEVRDATAVAGESADVTVVLRARGETVAGVQVDLHFDPRLPLARNTRGAPHCAVVGAIHKEATVFAFAPGTCGAGGGACSTVRAVVFSIANLDPIADGATLFTCRVEIPADTPAGAYPATASKVLAASPEGVGFAIGVRNGVVNVTASSAHNLESRINGSGSCSIQRQSAAGLGHLAAGLLVILLLGRRRGGDVAAADCDCPLRRRLYAHTFTLERPLLRERGADGAAPST